MRWLPAQRPTLRRPGQKSSPAAPQEELDACRIGYGRAPSAGIRRG